jgi:hypothetical protein
MATFIVRAWEPAAGTARSMLPHGLRGVVVAVATGAERRFMNAGELVAAINDLQSEAAPSATSRRVAPQQRASTISDDLAAPQP